MNINVGISCPKGKQSCACTEPSFTPNKEAIEELNENGWVKFEGNPVFNKGERGEWDAGGVTCFVVRHFPWCYMLWYSVGGEWSGFGLAQSRDGINWVKHRNNPVMVPDSGITVWGPEVLHDGELYHMWYVSRGLDGGMDGISHCTSEDGVAWVQSEANPVIDHGGCNAVIWDSEQFRMFLQSETRVGRQPRSAFELLTSADGETWESQGYPFIAGAAGEWDEITAAPSIAFYEGQLHLWYTGADTVGNARGEIAIGHLVSDNWGESFQINERNRIVHRELRPTEEWEGRGLYSSGIDYDGENVYVWYAATGANGGFGFASRPVQSVSNETQLKEAGPDLWTVAPNPFSSSVRINYLGTMDAPVSLALFDLNGRILLQQEFAANQPVCVDPRRFNLPVGQYLLRLNTRGTEIYKQMVLVK